MKKRTHIPVQKSKPNRPYAASVVPGGVGSNVNDGGDTAAAIHLQRYHERLGSPHGSYDPNYPEAQFTDQNFPQRS
jgi:hypothetical protein